MPLFFLCLISSKNFSMLFNLFHANRDIMEKIKFKKSAPNPQQTIFQLKFSSKWIKLFPFLIFIPIYVNSQLSIPVSSVIKVLTKESIEKLVEEEDTDGDKKITLEDPRIPRTERGDKRFFVKSIHEEMYEVAGTYFLSNLLQELKLAEIAGMDTCLLNPEKIFEPPCDRISRIIKEVCWNGLTRRMDEEKLFEIMQDEKITTVDSLRYIYLPHEDSLAYHYFLELSQRHPEARIKVEKLPQKITAEYLRKLHGRHGLLSLALEKVGHEYHGVPFVVPGGRFNEMYGWDSYFIVSGLIQDGKVELAKSMVDHFIYEIEHYGKILNANRTYYFTRSQPPFFTSMIRTVYAKLPKNNETKQWLQKAIGAAIKEYLNVWLSPERLTPTSLSRYFDTGKGPPPEVEPGHFDVIFKPYAEKHKMDVKEFEEAYRLGKFHVSELDSYFVHDRSMRESGHDRSYRLINRCAHLVTVDLNSLLYKFEMDIGEILEKEFNGKMTFQGKVESSSKWFERAKKRKHWINTYLWDPEKGMFFDYDFVRGERIAYVSATTFYPLWSQLASKEQAEKLIQNVLPLLEAPGGVLASTLESRGDISDARPATQWDYPYGWAPHQILVWEGLLNYGYDFIAYRLIYKWLYTITINAVLYNGTIAEKYDVVKRSHEVFVEYGNIGTKFSYITQEGFGWTNASFQVGLNRLPENLKKKLNQLIPPEWIFY